VIIVIALVCVLVGKFIMYAFGRLRGSGGMTAIAHRVAESTLPRLDEPLGGLRS